MTDEELEELSAAVYARCEDLESEAEWADAAPWVHGLYRNIVGTAVELLEDDRLMTAEQQDGLAKAAAQWAFYGANCWLDAVKETGELAAFDRGKAVAFQEAFTDVLALFPVREDPTG